MKRAIGNGLMALLLLGIVGASGYFFSVQMASPPYKDWGLSAIVIAVVASGLVYSFALNGYENKGAPDLQMQLRPRAPKKAPPAIETALTPLALLTMFFFGLYWRHTSHASEKTLTIDAWWPVILPVATGVTALAWLTDTLFLRIINGSHSGRSPVALRSALVFKRVAAAALAFAGVYWLGLSHLNAVQEAYRSALAQAWLSAVPALAISVVVIRR